MIEIYVRQNNVDQALRALKKKLQNEGVLREMKARKHYEKPITKSHLNAAFAKRQKPSVAPASWPENGLRSRDLSHRKNVSRAAKRF